MSRIRIELGNVVRHCVCANCGESQITPSDPANAILEVSVTISASVGDRLKAMDLLAKYGLGTSNEVHDDRGAEQLPTAEERKARVMKLIG